VEAGLAFLTLGGTCSSVMIYGDTVNWFVLRDLGKEVTIDGQGG
jgi:hypothetical protein